MTTPGEAGDSGTGGGDAVTEEVIRGFCVGGHGMRIVQEHEGYLLCLDYCWKRRKSIVATLRATVARQGRRGKGGANRNSALMGAK